MNGRRETLTAARKKRAKKLLAAQQWSAARELYAEICRIDPLDYAAWLELADLSVKVGIPADAEAACRQALSLRPQASTPCLTLGLLYKSYGRFVEAEEWLRRYMELLPAGVVEYRRLGTELQQRGMFDLAIAIYRGVLRLMPEDADTLNNLGVALHNSGQLDEALTTFESALALQPKAHLHCNLGNVHVDRGDYDQALHCYQQALRLDPRSTYAFGSLGALYMKMMRLEEARAALDQALAIDPNFIGGHWNRAQLLLLQGEFKQGWQEYESRLYAPEVVQRFGRREFSKPLWDGSSAADKTVLVYAEQGFGDAVQFCRYLPRVQQRVGRVIFECRPELLRLMQGLAVTVECVARRDDFREPTVAFDYQLPLLSLPRLFGTELTTIPAQTPYLNADPVLAQQWRGRIQGDGIKVGLVWAGSPTHQSDRYRSMTLAQLAPLAQLSGITFVSLQKGAAAQQLATAAAAMNLIDLTAQMNDFADTAAVIANLDLVISVDTAVAHLAGALGKPVWVLLYYPPEWRWLLDRDDSPWYPTMRLFRQGARRDWGLVVQQLAVELQRLIPS